MTDLSPDVPGGSPLADIPTPAIGTAITASGLTALFSTGYLLASPASAPAWAVSGMAALVLTAAAAIAITKHLSK